jgi:hypothetical protein
MWNAGVDIYDAKRQLWSTASLSVGRSDLSAATAGRKALFAGGFTGQYASAAASDVVDIYDSVTGSWTTSRLSVPREYMAAVSAGNLAFFAGGHGGRNPDHSIAKSDVVDIYDANTDKWSATRLSQARTLLAGARVGNKVLFGGGEKNDGGHGPKEVSGVVDIFTVREPFGDARANEPLKPNTERDAAGPGAPESPAAAHKAPLTSSRRTILAPGPPQPGWSYPRADAEGSGFYPYASTVRAPGPFVPMWSLTTPTLDGQRSVLTGDVNGDGMPELVLATGNKVQIYDGHRHLIRTISPPLASGRVDVGVLADFDGDGIPDIGIGTKDTSQLHSWFYKGDGTLLQSFAMQFEGGQSDRSMVPVAVTPATAIMSLSSGYARSPRGCAAYAKDTGNLAWYYRLGPAGEVESVASIKDQLCITGCCGSVHNGASGNGWNHNGTLTTDRSIYTVVVNQDGSEVFTHDYRGGVARTITSSTWTAAV